MKVCNDLLVALMAVIAVASSASPAGADVRATDPVAGYGRYVAAMPPAAPMSLYVSLPGRHPAEIDGLIAAQNTPGSRYFHHYLTPQAYGAYFGADPGRLSAAIAALRYHGFVVDQVLANRRDLIVHAPASVVESYFQTPIDLRNDGQRSFYAAHYIPQPHGALEGANVSGLESYRRLNDHHRMNPHVRVGRVCVAFRYPVRVRPAPDLRDRDRRRHHRGRRHHRASAQDRLRRLQQALRLELATHFDPGRDEDPIRLQR